MKYARTWRLGLAALYLVAVLMAALLPAGHGAVAHAMGSSIGMSAGCDDMDVVVADSDHSGCPQADHQVPDTCDSGSLCHMAHLWVPDASAVSLPRPVAAREMPPLVVLPPGVARAPDLRPPRLSA